MHLSGDHGLISKVLTAFLFPLFGTVSHTENAVRVTTTVKETVTRLPLIDALVQETRERQDERLSSYAQANANVDIRGK